MTSMVSGYPNQGQFRLRLTLHVCLGSLCFEYFLSSNYGDTDHGSGQDGALSRVPTTPSYKYKRDILLQNFLGGLLPRKIEVSSMQSRTGTFPRQGRALCELIRNICG